MWMKDVENGVVDTVGEGEGGMGWDSGTDLYTLPCVKSVAHVKLLYNTECSARCCVMTRRGGVGKAGMGGRL